MNGTKKTITLSENMPEAYAKARTRKAVEKLSLLIDSYYYLRKRLEENENLSDLSEKEQKELREKLAALQEQLQNIEKEMQNKNTENTHNFDKIIAVERFANFKSLDKNKNSYKNAAKIIKIAAKKR